MLSDAEKRRKYDELGQSYQRWQQTGGGPSGFDWNQWSAAGGQGGGPGARPAGTRVSYGDINDLFGQGGDSSDFFEAIFGGMGAARARGRSRETAAGMRSQDLEHEVEISLEEAFGGAQRIVEMDGRRLEVKIPAGVKTGSRVRVAGEGPAGASRSASRGDLYLRMKVLPHPVFERRDDDLHCEVPVDLFAALLGGEVARADAGGIGGAAYSSRHAVRPHLSAFRAGDAQAALSTGSRRPVRQSARDAAGEAGRTRTEARG